VLTVDSTVDLLHLLGDATRVRLLSLLARDELTVAELTQITELSQSRVSTHLGRLKEAGLLRDRKVGASTFYALNESAMPASARKLWELVKGEVSDGVLEADAKRSDALRRARDGAASWPDSIAGEMERHYSPGRTWEATARALLGFLRLGDVLDAGSGDGAIAQLLASRSKSITCVDRSERMIEAARRRLSAAPNVRLVQADMHELPFAAASFDQVLLLNALTYSEAPKQALAEAARVLRPGGTLAAVTLAAHDHEVVTAAYGHVQAGVSPNQLRRWLESAELSVVSCQVTSRERRKPYFEVVTAFAEKPCRNGSGNGHA
jgi:ArsR family transcriptional regulator